ncbi:hypothetical protein LCGC14_1707880 [marine sediment metagenome]|uniref:Uncharacterized protein n=1 Tax=marine sediment metagenome TaxID=412755 RepID=A0A0F9HGI4_9ZZZZ
MPVHPKINKILDAYFPGRDEHYDQNETMPELTDRLGAIASRAEQIATSSEEAIGSIFGFDGSPGEEAKDPQEHFVAMAHYACDRTESALTRIEEQLSRV